MLWELREGLYVKKKKEKNFRRVPEIDNIGLDKGKVSVELGTKYK